MHSVGSHYNRIIGMNIKNYSNLDFNRHSYQSNNIFKGKNVSLSKDEFIQSKDKPIKKEEKKMWKYIAAGAFILALIADIIVERKIRVDDKAKIDALKKDKELTNKIIKDLEEQSKKLEDEINKQKEIINQLKNGGKDNNNNKPPKIDVDPDSKK